MSRTKGTWKHWVDEHYDVLLSRATALFRGNTQNATDFLHDLLLELRRKWDVIDHPLAWISQTMRFRMVDYLATQKAPVAQAETPQTPVDVPLQMDIEAAIERLPSKPKRVLLLFLGGKSIEQIAATTGLSTDAVYQRLSRARKALKDALGDKAHGPDMQTSPTQASTFAI